MSRGRIPSLAGLTSFEEAWRATLGVEECVDWIKRHHFVLRRLHQTFTSRLTAEPVYELKAAFSYHGYLCAEHVGAIRQRVSELREPPLGLEVVPDEALALVCDEVHCAPTTAGLLIGLYEVLLPALIDSHRKYRETTNPLADAPSVRIARFCQLELEEMLAFGREAIGAVVTDTERGELDEWVTWLEKLLAAGGGLHGRDERPAGDMDRAPRYSAARYVFDAIPRRDERFHDGYNGGVNPEAFLYDERFSARDKVLMIYYKRLRELDVPEMMAGLLQDAEDKPWEYHAEMTRQLWDEMRHSLLGEVGFEQLGLDWTRIPVNFTWSLNLNTQLTPRERHAVLFFIEQGLMPRSGKRYEWEVGQASGIPLAAVIQDFDWADEVLHAQIGRRWYVTEFEGLKPAMDFGDRCWSKVASHWRDYRDQGLTTHRNWWPELYRAACARWGVEPDPEALAFDVTYEDTRADLKTIGME